MIYSKARPSLCSSCSNLLSQSGLLPVTFNDTQVSKQLMLVGLHAVKAIKQRRILQARDLAVRFSGEGTGSTASALRQRRTGTAALRSSHLCCSGMRRLYCWTAGIIYL